MTRSEEKYIRTNRVTECSNDNAVGGLNDVRVSETFSYVIITKNPQRSGDGSTASQAALDPP